MSVKSSLLLIGEDKQQALSLAAHNAKARLTVVESISNAIEHLCLGGIDMVFATAAINLPHLFSELKANQLNTPVVAIGPASPTQNAVKAIRLGAIEYLTEPPEEKLVQALLAKFNQTEESKENGPIAADPATLELIAQAEQFAASDATILLRGESGTGKEVFSRLIHNASPRKNEAFVSVNCAAIPESLLESELFGHKKGAFSGAVSDRAGKFEQAHGGTLLLDEISEMDLALQAKLLRAIQERVIDPVGSTRPVEVDIRLIATTNRNLEDYVAEGKFREDLYFRLNVVALDLPSLRNRPKDIPALATFFCKKYAAETKKHSLTLSTPALEKLQNCYWKGNVRELENTIHRAVLMAATSEKILPEHIVISPMSLRMMEQRGDAPETTVAAANVNAAASSQPANSAQQAAAARYAAAGGNFESGTGGLTSAAPAKSLQDVEKEHILSTLNYCQGNREHAADILGISIQILKEKLSAYQ